MLMTVLGELCRVVPCCIIFELASLEFVLTSFNYSSVIHSIQVFMYKCVCVCVYWYTYILLFLHRLKDVLPREYCKEKAIDKLISAVSSQKNFSSSYIYSTYICACTGHLYTCTFALCICLQEHRKLYGMSVLHAKFRYIELCRSLRTYGVSFFAVKVCITFTICTCACMWFYTCSLVKM